MTNEVESQTRTSQSETRTEADPLETLSFVVEYEPGADAEVAVLGAVLLQPESFDAIAGLVRPQDFATIRNRIVFEAMASIAARGDRVDPVLINAHLKSRGELSTVGDQYVAMLDAFVPSAGSGLAYARVVRDQATKIATAKAGAAIVEQVRSHQGTTDELLDRVGATLATVTDDRPQTGGLQPISARLKGIYDAILERGETKREVTGLATNLEDLDKMTGGLQPGNLIVVGARPGLGKTCLAINFALDAALRQRQLVAIFSLEMPTIEIIERMLSAQSRIEGKRLHAGNLEPAEHSRLANACDVLWPAAIEIDETPGILISDLRARAKGLAARKGPIGLVVVDYLQLVRAVAIGREQQVAQVSRGLKALAKELGCPVLALAQLNRAIDKRDDKRPQISDLRESGQIEQDADLVIFIYREDVYDKNAKSTGTAELILAKQRNGNTGTVGVAFTREFGLFENRFHDAPQREFHDADRDD